VISPVESVETFWNNDGDISGDRVSIPRVLGRGRVPREEVSQDSQLSRVLPYATLPLAVFVISIH
jgi:hypothetical protein